jgi:flagellar biosynthesis/type III secretory pathway protein FliH
MGEFVPLFPRRSWRVLGPPVPAASVAVAVAEPLPAVEPPVVPEADPREEMWAAREAARMAEFAASMAELEAAKARHRSAAARLGQLCGELATQQAAMVAELRAVGGELVLAGARRVATDALRADPAVVASLVEEALAAVAADDLVVAVHPDDVPAMEAALDGRGRAVGDASVRAGAVFRGRCGRMDASVDTAMEALRAAVQAWKA